MANPLGIFYSRLAPEDKRFIKKIGVFLVLLLLASGAALYFLPNFIFSSYGKEIVEQFQQITGIQLFEKQDSTSFELPPPPVVPEGIDEKSDTLTESTDTTETAKAPETPELTENAESDTDSQPMESQGPVSIQGVSRLFLENPKLAARVGHLLLEAGYPEEAVYILQNGVSLNSAPISVLVDLAYGHFYSKRFETALSGLETALGKYPGNAELLTAKAAISGLNPDTSLRSSAESMFKTILKKSPEAAEANYQYGRYIMQRGDFKKSYEYLEKAFKVEPYNSRYIARLGMAEFYLKRDSNAEDLYKKALKINPYDCQTWFNLGELYLSEANESGSPSDIRKKTKNALEAYLKAIELDSTHANAHYRIGIILNANGGYKEAIRHLTTALAKMPVNTSVMMQLGSAYMQLGDTTKYIDYLNNILQIDPFDKVAGSEFKRLNKEN
ncbi:MAG: tetratricopeptide repeat protein [Fibromonadaceae bacterium]|nr:tetratricopeptide repeat protein [Fibromonadaceae bacterium]